MNTLNSPLQLPMSAIGHRLVNVTVAIASSLIIPMMFQLPSQAVSFVSLPTLEAIETETASSTKPSRSGSTSRTKSAYMHGPDGEFSLWMPGQITRNTHDSLDKSEN